MDTKREPKEIQEEVLKKKLKLTHPFKGQLDKDIKFPNAHEPFFYYHKDKAKHGSWRIQKFSNSTLQRACFFGKSYDPPRYVPLPKSSILSY